MLTYSKYPFIISLEEYSKMNYGYRIDINSLLENEKIVKISKKRLGEAITKKVSPLKNGDTTDEEVYSFYVSLAAIKASNSVIALDLFAKAEANRASYFIDYEDEENLIALSNAMGLKIEKELIKIPWIINTNGKITYRMLPYYVKMEDYLKIAVNAQENAFRLVNSFLLNGKVYLDIKILKRLLEVGIIVKIKNISKDLEINDLVLDFSNEIFRYLKLAENKIPTSKIEYKAFPPCMTSFRELLDKGKIDEERLYQYIAFLISIGIDEEELSDILANGLGISPNLSKRIAKAFLSIEDLSPYRCDVMKKKNLCPKDCGGKHPVLVYKKNLQDMSNK
ncbi:DNA primase, large subunit [Caldisphaera lagunensis DSM 15908]|uniref:DNA primase large subunit PriL n=1 Tax=Caldisphaera lagunensis (strain DSM 15908 / JCM 11604 / ANMR 0165 / IC-154) TaxID=1056495 RepID=L0AB33_CALLD|nr:DNA primase large subunit [Caldisphaera lagunensis]AFZ70255.1 DNA primase, large subunit [Caldisphaera lagunensis DSM 15908]